MTSPNLPYLPALAAVLGTMALDLTHRNAPPAWWWLSGIAFLVSTLLMIRRMKVQLAEHLANAQDFDVSRQYILSLQRQVIALQVLNEMHDRAAPNDQDQATIRYVSGLMPHLYREWQDAADAAHARLEERHPRTR